MNRKIILSLISMILVACLVVIPVFVKETSTEVITDTRVDRMSESRKIVDVFDQMFLNYLNDNGYADVNYLVSPASFRAALCLVISGAVGNTQDQLLKAAGFASVDEMQAWYVDNLQYNTGSDDSVFWIANSIWMNKDMGPEFSAEYQDLVGDVYDAGAYAANADEITDRVNAWCNEKTNGLIPMVSNDLSTCVSVLVNALYLNTDWMTEFKLAGEYIFTDIDGVETTMDFIEDTDDYLYADIDGTQIVAIPMEGNITFVAFMGNRDNMFEKLSELNSEKVHIRLPKFEMTSEFGTKELAGFLMDCGVTDAFSSEKADFSFMCPDVPWCVDDLIQKTKFKTDENGIEAAAVTGIFMDLAAAPESSPVQKFVADEPFVYAIYSNFQTLQEQMLFYGQMMRAK